MLYQLSYLGIRLCIVYNAGPPVKMAGGKKQINCPHLS